MTRNLITAGLCLAVLALVSGCASIPPQPWAKPQVAAQARQLRLGRVTVQVPAGVEWVGSDPRMDFMVTRFSKGGRQLLLVYLGNAPDLSYKGHEAKQAINGLEAASHIEAKDGRFSREVLLTLPGQSWATKVQALYGGLDAEGAGVADGIIGSVKLAD